MNSKIRALIIDGSYTNRILLKALLEDFDFEVTEACNTLKALQMLDNAKPNIILLELSEPFKNGYDFLDSIGLYLKGIPVIVISVYDDQQIIREAYKRGASEYFIKPIDTQKLAIKLSHYVECVI